MSVTSSSKVFTAGPKLDRHRGLGYEVASLRTQDVDAKHAVGFLVRKDLHLPRRIAKSVGADLVSLDTDGNAMEFTGIARSYGVGGIFPYEVKAGNDLFKLREQYPDFVLFGWLEKESVN